MWINRMQKTPFLEKEKWGFDANNIALSLKG
jgi:hypothetical protein